MTYDDQLKSDEKHPFWSNPLLYKQGGTTQENTGQDTPAFDSQTTGREELGVIADTGSPLVEGIAFLEADVVDGEGNQFFFGHFIGIFVMMWHRAHSLSFGW